MVCLAALISGARSRANGLMSPEYPQNLDRRRATAAGVDMSASSRYRLQPNEGRDVRGPLGLVTGSLNRDHPQGEQR